MGRRKFLGYGTSSLAQRAGIRERFASAASNDLRNTTDGRELKNPVGKRSWLMGFNKVEVSDYSSFEYSILALR